MPQTWPVLGRLSAQDRIPLEFKGHPVDPLKEKGLWNQSGRSAAQLQGVLQLQSDHFLLPKASTYFPQCRRSSFMQWVLIQTPSADRDSWKELSAEISGTRGVWSVPSKAKWIFTLVGKAYRPQVSWALHCSYAEVPGYCHQAKPVGTSPLVEAGICPAGTQGMRGALSDGASLSATCRQSTAIPKAAAVFFTFGKVEQTHGFTESGRFLIIVIIYLVFTDKSSNLFCWRCWTHKPL